MYSRHSQHLFVPALVGRLFKIPVILEVNGKLIEETSHIANSRDLNELCSSRKAPDFGIFQF